LWGESQVLKFWAETRIALNALPWSLVEYDQATVDWEYTQHFCQTARFDIDCGHDIEKYKVMRMLVHAVECDQCVNVLKPI